MAAIGLGGCCPPERPFPIVWRTQAPLSRHELVARFEPTMPSIARIGTVRELSDDAELNERLEIAGFRKEFAELGPEKRLEVLAWETTCRGQTGQLVLGVFDPASGEVLSVDGKELFFSRVAVSSH